MANDSQPMSKWGHVTKLEVWLPMQHFGRLSPFAARVNAGLSSQWWVLLAVVTGVVACAAAAVHYVESPLSCLLGSPEMSANRHALTQCLLVQYGGTKLKITRKEQIGYAVAFVAVLYCSHGGECRSQLAVVPAAPCWRKLP